MGKKKKKKQQQQAAAHAARAATEAAPAPAPATPPPPPAATGGWRFAWALALLGVLLYSGTTSHGFTLDDIPLVQNSQTVNEGRAWDALWEPYWPPGTEASNWRPLVSASWAVERKLFASVRKGPGDTMRRDAAPTHHGLNALLHGLLVLCLFPLARRLTGHVGAAWMACGLFALHPAHTEAVAPVVGRTDLLAAIGVLAALEWWCRYRESGATKWLAFATIAYAVGLGGKESAAPLLLLLPLADVWLCGRSWASLKGPAAKALLPFVGVALCYGVLRWIVLAEASFAHGQAVELGALGRVGFAARNSWTSTLLLFFPFRFHHIITSLPSDAEFLGALPGFFGNVAWAVAALPIWFGWIWLARRSPVGAFCWVASLAVWAPTSGLLAAAAGVALRFLLLPTAFLACGVARAGVAALRRWPNQRNTLLAVAAAWGGVAVGFTIWRTPQWKNNGTFYTALLAEVPDTYTANYGLGTWVIKYEKDVPRARALFAKAVAIAGETEKSVKARLNLAKSYEFPDDGSGTEWGPGAQIDKALELYEQAHRIKPDDPAINLQLGRLRYHLNQRAGALTHFETLLRVQPDIDQAPEIRARCGEILRDLGRLPEARAAWRVAARAWETRADDLAQRGFPAQAGADRGKAVVWLKAALGLGADAPEAQQLLAEIRRLEALR